MKKRFIVCVNNSDKSQDQEFIKYIKSKKLGWWHWIQNVWLISDPLGIMSRKEIRDTLIIIYKGENNLVFELKENEGAWVGYGPKNSIKNMFTWIKKNFSKRPD